MKKLSQYIPAQKLGDVELSKEFSKQNYLFQFGNIFAFDTISLSLSLH